MKERSDKRGISPVVATVLLITMGIIVVAIIFIWARGSIEERGSKFGTDLEQVCDGLNIDVSVSVSGSTVSVVNRESQYAIEGLELRDSDGDLVSCDLNGLSPGDTGTCTASGTFEAAIPVLKGDDGSDHNCVNAEISI